MESVFDVFSLTQYEFLTIKRGQVYGDRIVNRKTLMGVFKLKTGIASNRNMEEYKSDATLHARPEDFDTEDYSSLVGQGIAVEGVNYSIEGVSVGKNFDNGKIEHIFMRLQKANFVEASNGTDTS